MSEHCYPVNCHSSVVLAGVYSSNNGYQLKHCWYDEIIGLGLMKKLSRISVFFMSSHSLILISPDSSALYPKRNILTGQQ